MINKRFLVLIFLLVFLPLVGCLPTPTPSNEAPIITSTPITTATVGVAYTYDVGATDPDDDILTYSLITKPTGMTIDSTTGLIEWKPTFGQVGDNAVTVGVSDGDLSVTQSFTIKVSKPTPTPIPTKFYTITATADTGGSISPSGDITVKKGSDKLFIITPTVFYSIADVLVDTVSEGAISSYTFNNVTQDHTIEASFILLGRVYNQTENKHYDNIQDAIDDAGNPGDTILVGAGIYPENVTINVDGIVLKSVEKHGAEIQGQIKIGTPPSTHANGVTIEDFYINFDSITGAPIDIILADGLTIRGNKVEGGATDAMGINCSTGPNTVHGNVLIENNEVIKGCIGIMTGNLPTNIVIRNNTMTGPLHEGIWFYLASNMFLTLEDNTVIGAGLTDVKIVEKPLSINGVAGATEMAQEILDSNLGINSVYLQWIPETLTR